MLIVWSRPEMRIYHREILSFCVQTEVSIIYIKACVRSKVKWMPKKLKYHFTHSPNSYASSYLNKQDLQTIVSESLWAVWNELDSSWDVIWPV